MELKIDFEYYLMEKHSEQYVGTKDCMVDDFNDWVQDLPIDDVIRYADNYLKNQLQQKDEEIKRLNGKVSEMVDTINKFKGIATSDIQEANGVDNDGNPIKYGFK